jgi:ABC-type transporter Mla subunit MlaD
MSFTRPFRRPVSHSNRRMLIVLGILTCLAGLVALWIGVNAPNQVPGRSYYTLHAYFRGADNLVVHDQVRLGGEDIGQVLNPRIVNGLAEVDLQLNPSVAPLHAGTTLRIRPRSLVGVQFVEVHATPAGPALANGATIPVSHTSAAVTYDRVFNILDAPRRLEAQTLVQMLGGGIAGRGGDLNETLQEAPGYFQDAGGVAAAINSRPGAAAGFVGSTAAAMNAIAPVRSAMASGFSPEAQAMQPFIDHSADVQSTLTTAPSTLNAAATQLPAVQGLLSQVDGMAVAAHVTLAPAPATLQQTNAMLTESHPGLKAAVGTLQRLDSAVSPTLNLLGSIAPVLPELNNELTSGKGILIVLDPRGCDLKNFWYNWAESTAFGDAGGEFLRLGVVHPSLEQLQSGFQANPIRAGFGTNPYPAPCQAQNDFVKGP